MITFHMIRSRMFAMLTTIATIAMITTMMAAPGVAGAQEAGDKQPPQDVIVTTGEGTVRIAPDQAFVSITAESRARTPREAQRLNADAMSAVQQKLKAAGFSGDAVRTLQLELQPQYDYQNGKQTLREYLARNTIEVRVEPVDRTGEIADLAVGSGATSVSNIRFELKDRRAVEHRALQEAVTQARGRADAIAQAGNRAVDRIIRIEDQPQEQVSPPRPMMAMARAEVAQAQTPIAPGVLEIHARVVLTAKMR